MRQHLERRFRDHPERAVAAAEEFHEVKAGDVLHHPAAGLDDFAAPVDEAQANEKIARRAH